MDLIDMKICKMLLMDSHQPYRAISESLSLSINAVHKRIQRLVSIGIIRKFRTILKLITLDAAMVWFFGKTETTTIELLQKNLERNDKVFWIALGAGNFAYIGAYVESIHDLDSLVTNIKNLGDFSELTVGLITVASETGTENQDFNNLTQTDFQILNELHNDSRKNTAEIAEKIGISAKTVSKRLEAMIEKRLIEFTIDFYPDTEGDIMNFVHITLDADIDRNTVMGELYQKYFDNLLFIQSFSNLPQLLIAVFWVPSFKQFQVIQKEIVLIHGIKSVEFNIMFKGIILESWRDRVSTLKLGNINK